MPFLSGGGTSPVFCGKKSNSTNVKALWGQLGPTLSEMGRLCKKGLFI